MFKKNIFFYIFYACYSKVYSLFIYANYHFYANRICQDSNLRLTKALKQNNLIQYTLNILLFSFLNGIFKGVFVNGFKPDRFTASLEILLQSQTL